jgi:hypothetical protein
MAQGQIRKDPLLSAIYVKNQRECGKNWKVKHTNIVFILYSFWDPINWAFAWIWATVVCCHQVWGVFYYLSEKGSYEICHAKTLNVMLIDDI